MALPSWWQIATPHKDIRDGKLTEAIFAADLGNLLSGKGPLEYQDPSIFFQKTYLTKGLQTLLDAVLTRLGGGKGDPVIQLQTPFGGGKTHALLTLYHAVQHREKVGHLESLSNLPATRNVKVAIFEGTREETLKGRTPWGEIAWQLNCYDLVKEYDERRYTPGKKILAQVLEKAQPVLILMDEIAEFVAKAPEDLATQTLAFSQEITETVKTTDTCALVCTLPSSIPLGMAGAQALNNLQQIFGRVEAIYTPVEGMEIYEVVRKRLFETLGDERTRKEVAQGYFDLYQNLGADVPSEVKDISYRDKLERAYPFHPELIDVLYERWSSFSTFQRTRGVLRLLAQVVANLYNKKVVSPLIHSALVNLEEQRIRREFIKHIGNEFDAVIAADIVNKAPRIDREMGSEYEKYAIAKGIATSVFLGSFSAGQSQETTLPRIRVSLLREGIPITIVGDAVAKLEEELWYFHSEKNQYAFRSQPNLNRVILDREETISDDKVKEELKNLIQKNAGRALEVYAWPEAGSDIPDNKNLKLAIFSPNLPYESDKGKQLAKEIFEKAGTGFRIYKNTLFVLLIDTNQYVSLIKSLKRYLALMSLLGDEALVKTLSKPSQEEIRKKPRDSEKEIPFKIVTAYRYLGMVQNGSVHWPNMGIPTIGSDQTLSERVRQYLTDQEKLLRKITPKYILDRAFGRDEDEKSIREIFDLHLKTPGMPLLIDERVLLDAVSEGVKTGILGLRQGTSVYFMESVTADFDSLVLRGEVAKRLKEEEELKRRKVEEEVSTIEGPPKLPAGVTPDKEKGEKEKIRSVTLRAKVPWDKLSDITKGVIAPLKDEGLPPEITIEIKASSEEGFKRHTLNSKVKETLLQINAKIERWEEE